MKRVKPEYLKLHYVLVSLGGIMGSGPAVAPRAGAWIETTWNRE